MKKITIKQAALSLAVLAALSCSLQAQATSHDIELLAADQFIDQSKTTTDKIGYLYSQAIGNLKIGDESHQVTVSAATSGSYYVNAWDGKQQNIPASGVLIRNGSVTSITVAKGASVSALNGITVVTTDNNPVKVGDITNDGTIASKGKATTTPGQSLFSSNAGLFLAGVHNNGSALMQVGTVKNTGVMSSEAGAGLMIGNGVTVQEIVNNGTISGGTDGIRIYYKNVGGWYSASTVTNGLTNTASISGGIFGLRLDDAPSANRKINFGTIKVSGSGAAITGGKTGVYLGNWTQVGKIELTSGATIQGTGGWANGLQIQYNATVAGISLSNSSISGTDSGVVINGANSKITGGIRLESGSSITGSNQGMYTAGRIQGGIYLGGSSSITATKSAGIWNAGTIGKIVVTGSPTDSKHSGAAIVVTGNSKITSGIDGIRNGVKSGSAVIDGSIYIDEGAKVTGVNGSGYGINNWDNASIKGDIISKGTLSGINNAGTITGKIEVHNTGSDSFWFSNSSGINGAVNLAVSGQVVAKNYGTIGSHWTISGASGSSLINEGTVKGNLSFTTPGNLTIQNQRNSQVQGTFNVTANNGTVNFLNIGSSTGALTIKSTATSGANRIQNGANVSGAFTVTVASRDDLTLVNSGHVSGNLTSTSHGNVSGGNSGQVDGNLILQTQNGSMHFTNTGAVTGKIEITNQWTDASHPQRETLQHNIQNGGNAQSLVVKVSGGLTFLNEGAITSDLTLHNDAGFSGSNTGHVSGALSIQTSGVLQFINTGSVGKGLTVSNMTQGVLEVTDTTTTHRLQNSGDITGDFIAKVTGQLQLLNTGRITGDFVSVDSSALTGQNDGDISGKLTLKATAGALNFTNKGTIQGAFELSNTARAGNSEHATSLVNVVQNTGALHSGMTVRVTGGLTLVNEGAVTGNADIATDANLSGSNRGDISGALSVKSQGNLQFVNAGHIGQDLTLTNHGASSQPNPTTSKNRVTQVIQNTGAVDGNFTAHITGDLQLVNQGAIRGSLVSIESDSFVGQNDGHVTGKLQIATQKGAVNFTNTGNVSGSFSISSAHHNQANTIENAGALAQGMSVKVSGSLTLHNAGQITGSITTQNDAAVVGWNTGRISGGIDIHTTNGTIDYTNRGDVTGRVSLVSDAGTQKSTVGNAAHIMGGLNVTVQGALDFANEGQIDSGLTLHSHGAIAGYNRGAVKGDVTLKTTSGAFNFENGSAVAGTLKLTSDAGQTQSVVTNRADITGGVQVTIQGGLNFTNTARIDQDVTLQIHGNGVIDNQGTLGQALTLKGEVADIHLQNSGDFKNGATLSGSGDFTLQNHSKVTGLVSVSGVHQSTLLNRGNFEAGLKVASSGPTQWTNEGTQTGDVTLIGTGPVTLQNQKSGLLQNVTLTDASAVSIVNQGALKGAFKLTQTGQRTQATGDFTLMNEGTVEGSMALSGVRAIEVVNAASGTLSAPLQIEGQGAIQLVNEGQWLAHDVTLSGDGNVTIQNSKAWSGNVSITGAKAITIRNLGDFKGQLHVAGTQGQAGVLTFENSAQLVGNVTLSYQSTDDTPSTLLNTGLYSGTMTLNGSGRLEVTSTGLFVGKIIRNGSGDVDVKEWHVAVTDTGSSAECDHCNRVTPTEVQKKAMTRAGDQIKIEKVIISHALPDKTNPSLSIDLNDVWQVNNQGMKPQEADLGDAVKSVGFKGYYTYNDGIFHTSFDTGVTAGAIISRTMASQLIRRDFFLEAAVNEAAVGALYHRRLDNIKGSVFVKPYTSYDQFEEDGIQASGHTQGVMTGATGFFNRHIITGIMGFERSQMESNYLASDLDLDMQSWYLSLMTSHIIYGSRFVDVFGKVTGKVSYTQTSAQRLLEAAGQSQASTHSLAYGANAQVGLNIRGIPNGNVIPMLGVGYSTGTTQAYQLDKTGTINDTYTPSRVHLPFADASVTWFQSWNAYIKTFLSAGYRFNFKPEQDTQVSFGANTIEGTYELPRHYEYVNYSTVIHMTKDSEIALGYTGVRDSMGVSHNLTTKYELHF